MLVIFWIIFSFLIDFTLTTEEAAYFKHHPDGKLIIPNENPFDWLAYLESRNDLTRESNTYPNALQHYETKGKHSKHNAFPNALPPLNTLPQQLDKLYTFINKLDELKIPKNQRTIVTYAVSGQTNPQQSIETLINNELLFNATITLDSSKAPKSISTNFYWIYTIGEINNLKDFISPNTWNSVVVDIPWPMSEALCFHRFIQLLQPYLMKNFGSMFFLSNNARGPFLLHEEGKWLQEYRSLLFQTNHPIGLVGPMLQCETQGAFIKLHAFMIKTETMPSLMQRFLAIDRLGFWIGYTKKQPLFIAGTLHHHGYNISSYLYYKRVNLTYFDGLCLSTPESQKDVRFHDPSKWCDITPDEVLFYEYGGELLRIPGMICESTLEIHRDYLQKNYEIVNNINTIPLKLPETIYSGLRYELYHQYEKEVARDYLVQKSLALSSPSSSSSALVSNNEIKRKDKKLWSQPLDPNGNKVCLLVRTAKMHGTKHHNNGPAVESVTGGGIDDLAESLLRQTDPNWEAILFITDNRPFETMLLRMLQKYNDSRFTYFDVPAKYRPAYSPTDAAYTPTDYVLRQVLHKRLDCRWISATNADNIYGSKVIENVRQTMHVKNHDDDSGVPDMVFVPLDSRNIADQDHDFRKTRETWNEFCLGINSMLFMNALAYTMQPRPFVGKVDLAAVFFNREKWFKENIYFGNFTDKNRRRCKGCQDGYFTEYLVHTRLWSYKRLPIDGLKSIVFHGPSPTWCIASGNVWFDHPEVSKVRCYSQKTANAIRHVDVPPKYVFDWQYFDEQERLCLRFSQAGFQKYQLVKTNKGKLHQQWQLLTASSPQTTSNDATMTPEGAPITTLDFPPTKAEIGGGAALIN